MGSLISSSSNNSSSNSSAAEKELQREEEENDTVELQISGRLLMRLAVIQGLLPPEAELPLKRKGNDLPAPEKELSQEERNERETNEMKNLYERILNVNTKYGTRTSLPPLPCSKTREAMIQCYGTNKEDVLKCKDLVIEFEKCARTMKQ